MTLRKSLFAVCGVAAWLGVPLGAQKSGVSQKPRLSFMDSNTISYIRPGTRRESGVRGDRDRMARLPRG